MHGIIARGYNSSRFYACTSTTGSYLLMEEVIKEKSNKLMQSREVQTAAILCCYHTTSQILDLVRPWFHNNATGQIRGAASTAVFVELRTRDESFYPTITNPLDHGSGADPAVQIYSALALAKLL